jgi:hypothetical protein
MIALLTGVRCNLSIVLIDILFMGGDVEHFFMCFLAIWTSSFERSFPLLAQLPTRCPTTKKWIKKMWYLYTVELYSATKKNEILSLASKWKELENVILSKVSQAKKAKNHMFFLICGLWT